jgi:carboxyl-terminal processing protease
MNFEKPNRLAFLLAVVPALAVGLACGQGYETTGTSAVASGQASPAAAPPAVPKAKAAAMDEDEEVPQEKFTSGANAFAEVRDMLLKKYYAEGLSEDDVYRAATAGMLEKLEPRMEKYNRLVSPREIAEIKNDLKGEVVGIGVKISFDEPSGYADVNGTIPHSPSEAAGLQPGDKIVTVNGKLYKGMKLKDVVADIRGKAGDPVILSILRGDKLLSFTVTRARVTYDTPSAELLPDKLGYLQIPSFTDRTPDAVRAALTTLEQGGARALAVDLRHSPGGSFERAIETAGLLLPEGSPVVVLKARGKADETRYTKGSPILGSVPVVVLVDGETASSSEFLAGALQEIRHARVVGTKTRGKWTVQSLENLPNGYAYKYTVGRFQTAGGRSFEGTGLVPDAEATMDETLLGKAAGAKPEERLAIDIQLRTAKELILHAGP